VRVSSRWVLDGGQNHKVTMDSGEPTPAYQLVIGNDHPPEGGLTHGTAQSTSEGIPTKVKGRGWKAKPYCQNTWSTRQDGQRRLEVCIFHVSWPAQHTTSVTPPSASGGTTRYYKFVLSLRSRRRSSTRLRTPQISSLHL